MTSLEIRSVPACFIVTPHDGDTATATDDSAVQNGAIIFVTPRVWTTPTHQIKQAIGPGE